MISITKLWLCLRWPNNCKPCLFWSKNIWSFAPSPRGQHIRETFLLLGQNSRKCWSKHDAPPPPPMLISSRRPCQQKTSLFSRDGWIIDYMRSSLQHLSSVNQHLKFIYIVTNISIHQNHRLPSCKLPLKHLLRKYEKCNLNIKHLAQSRRSTKCSNILLSLHGRFYMNIFNAYNFLLLFVIIILSVVKLAIATVMLCKFLMICIVQIDAGLLA
jgi:hypothetical protein